MDYCRLDAMVIGTGNLQTGSVDGLHVNGDLTTTIGNDHDADATTSTFEGLLKTGPEVGLVQNGNGLLDITGLGHGNNRVVLEIKNTVLLEDWSQHSLDDDTWAWVGDERGLFIQLSGEEVDTQVTVLASGSGGGDTDNLAGTSLEHQEVTHTDVVARNGNGVGRLLWSSNGWGSGFIIVVTHFEIDWFES